MFGIYKVLIMKLTTVRGKALEKRNMNVSVCRIPWYAVDPSPTRLSKNVVRKSCHSIIY